MKKMKKFLCALMLVVMAISMFTSCGVAKKEEIDPAIEEVLDEYTWEYPKVNYSYSPEREWEYWNLLEDDKDFVKMFYDANYNLDYSDATQKYIHCFYGDELEEYSWYNANRGILFSRLDHPELELLETHTNDGGGSLCAYTTYYIPNISYSEYQEKVEAINAEIQPLIVKVNSESDLYDKYKLIYSWILENYTYKETENDVKNVDFLKNGEFVLGRYGVNSNQSIESILSKEAICDGIADTFKYICNCCDLECMTVIGYVGDISEKQYHAWNIVPYNGKWFLVDATFGLSHDSYDYFMVEDLNESNRASFVFGDLSLPMYDSLETENLITFTSMTDRKVSSDEGITFSCENEDYVIEPSSPGNVDISFSDEGWDKIFDEEQEVSHEACLTSNVNISSVEYYSYGASVKTKIPSGNTFTYMNEIDDRYISYVKVYVDMVIFHFVWVSNIMFTK